MTATQQLKQTACQAIDSCRDELHELSQQIWDTPELFFEEHHAHQVSDNKGCLHVMWCYVPKKSVVDIQYIDTLQVKRQLDKKAMKI